MSTFGELVDALDEERSRLHRAYGSTEATWADARRAMFGRACLDPLDAACRAALAALADLDEALTDTEDDDGP